MSMGTVLTLLNIFNNNSKELFLIGINVLNFSCATVLDPILCSNLLVRSTHNKLYSGSIMNFLIF